MELEELTTGPNAVQVLGTAQNGVAACEGYVIACPLDCWDYSYSVSHEIAEHGHGFQHTPEMFAEQANTLARWPVVPAPAVPRPSRATGVSRVRSLYRTPAPRPTPPGP